MCVPETDAVGDPVLDVVTVPDGENELTTELLTVLVTEVEDDVETVGQPLAVIDGLSVEDTVPLVDDVCTTDAVVDRVPVSDDVTDVEYDSLAVTDTVDEPLSEGRADVE